MNFLRGLDYDSNNDMIVFVRLQGDKAANEHEGFGALAHPNVSRQASATLTACPNRNHLWCIGGEFFGEDGRAVPNSKFTTSQY